MIKANCRTANVCVFCKYWLGEEAEVNYRNGEAKYRKSAGICVKDKSNEEHFSDTLCRQFQRNLIYM